MMLVGAPQMECFSMFISNEWLKKSHSFQGRLLKHNLDSEVVDALKDLRNKLSENESK
ncbi:hypothetical protein CICLE_v10003790mg [Citrus x clementina]|uniref:Uncharacterized protein n=1 Tax=Citrus clementina TaxID=85681 RepID=V4UXS3_CITCL|nr:hypothetical protein CICLE_v10003790mg [Citrus x clementina]